MVRHQLIENRGASNQEPHIPRGLKKGIRKILTGMSVPLDACLLMGDFWSTLVQWETEGSSVDKKLRIPMA
jgi:hypothetical protein